MGRAKCAKGRNIKYNMRNSAGGDIRSTNDNTEDIQDTASDDESTCGRGKGEFSSATEQKLVEFFSENECFYNKGSPQFANI